MTLNDKKIACQNYIKISRGKKLNTRKGNFVAQSMEAYFA